MELSNEIKSFVEKYAAINPNFDPEYDDDEDTYTGPDVGELLDAAMQLKRGVKPTRIHSDWGSGCYKPYTSKDGKMQHNSILKRIRNL